MANLATNADDDAQSETADDDLEYGYLQQATVIEDGEPIAEIVSVYPAYDRERFKTRRFEDDELYNGLAPRVLENLEEDGGEIRFETKDDETLTLEEVTA